MSAAFDLWPPACLMDVDDFDQKDEDDLGILPDVFVILARGLNFTPKLVKGKM